MVRYSGAAKTRRVRSGVETMAATTRQSSQLRMRRVGVGEGEGGRRSRRRVVLASPVNATSPNRAQQARRDSSMKTSSTAEVKTSASEKSSVSTTNTLAEIESVGSDPATIAIAVADRKVTGKVYQLQPESRGQSRVSKEVRKNRKDPQTRKQEKLRERRTYRFLAVSSALLMFGLASGATWIRFFITDSNDGVFSLTDFYGTLSCTLGAVFGMEFYARYAHRYLWHENEEWFDGLLVKLHDSHHRPRTEWWEENDIFAVANALPALSLCIYGFLHPGLVAAMCWGTGLGITLYGWMYMFVHDGLVHKRFPVGPLAELPSLKRIAVAHTIHHSEKFGGVPYGLFFAEDELSKVEGGVAELDLLVERAIAKENERS
mmetsp:Transcript_5816/g.10653  ORF Transcript_5816/g.10653 Transcript_5816/m.10653 type:complete len:375 (+) Transcript_5816:356-1480(+)